MIQEAKPRGIAKIWREVKRLFTRGAKAIKLLWRQDQTNKKHNNILLKKIIKISGQNSKGSSIDILFMTPPMWDVYSPFSAVPCLVAELKKHGIKAKNIDIGIMVFHEMFNRNWHKESKILLRKNFYENRVSSYIHKDFKTYEEYLAKIEFLNNEELKMKDFQKIYPSLDFVQQGVFDILVKNLIKDYSVSIDVFRKITLDQLVDQFDISTIFNAIEEFRLTEDFLNLPKIVGLSITSQSQFVPALGIIQILKAFKPDVKIIAGGSYLATIKKANPDALIQLLENYADFVVIGEGETAVRMFVEHIKDNKHALSSIPNLIYLNHSQLYSTNNILEDVTTLCTPDYEGIDFSLYLAQEPILSYQTSRGCFWGHCAFCNHEESYRRNFRIKKVETVVSNLRTLTERYHIYNFQFVDEAIEPKYFIEFVEALSKEEFSQKIKWFYYSRVSPLYNDEIVQKAKQCGCEMVMFGVETFNQRLLTFVKKGTTTKNIISNLELFHRNGIKTHAWLMWGLPTQTEEELLADIEILSQNLKNIDVCSLGRFYLNVHCDMYKCQKLFGITKSNKLDGYDFESQNNGKTICIEKLREIVRNNYSPLIKKHVFLNTRYLTFFKK